MKANFSTNLRYLYHCATGTAWFCQRLLKFPIGSNYLDYQGHPLWNISSAVLIARGTPLEYLYRFTVTPRINNNKGFAGLPTGSWLIGFKWKKPLYYIFLGKSSLN
jgi:hypothetical protein